MFFILFYINALMFFNCIITNTFILFCKTSFAVSTFISFGFKSYPLETDSPEFNILGIVHHNESRPNPLD